jgi:hypothetical protein
MAGNGKVAVPNAVPDDPTEVVYQGYTDYSAHDFASATSSGAVTKSDSTVLDFNAIWVGGDGNISIDHTEGGAAVTYIGAIAGTILPVSGVRVNNSTTATNLVWMKW